MYCLIIHIHYLRVWINGCYKSSCYIYLRRNLLIFAIFQTTDVVTNCNYSSCILCPEVKISRVDRIYFMAFCLAEHRKHMNDVTRNNFMSLQIKSKIYDCVNEFGCWNKFYYWFWDFAHNRANLLQFFLILNYAQSEKTIA